ncbi:MAG: alpha/beta fold hydrolase [Candidatus Eisenbacteria bacterium]|nr:alpha/beta fold hydrolase [Candidatus Eisenbacteria bacterium]
MASTPDWIDRQEYPFDSHYLQVPAGRMHYVDEGRGRPVVMLHGNPAWSFLYRHLIKRLRPEFRCVAPDHIGFGLSHKPRSWSYLPAEHAGNLTVLIDDLGLKDIILVVQDWGGPIGMSYAVAHPQNVAGLVIMNTWAWPVDRDWYYIAFSGFMGGPMGRWLIRHYNFFARSIMRRVFGDKRKLTRSIHEHYLRALATPADRKGSYVFPRQIIKSTPWLEQIWNRASRLNGKPKLIVWGMADIAFRRKELKRWEDRFPEARVVRLSSVGHFVQEEAPEDLAEAVLSFLREMTPQ